MFAAERQQAMAELVNRHGRVSVNELAREFAVTTETIRRDLSVLEEYRLLRRVHGGAVQSTSLGLLETALAERDLANVEAKRRIAEVALGLLPDAGGTVLLDAGTTTARLADLLPHDLPLTVYTHAVPIAGRIAGHPKLELHLLPGTVRPNTQAAVGVETVAALGRLRADVAFLGTNGISLGHGLSTPDPTEAATKMAMLSAAHRIVVLSDASKFGLEHTVRFAELGQIDVLVTDSIGGDYRSALEALGVEVLLPSRAGDAPGAQ